jgi:hypothetical protein
MVKQRDFYSGRVYSSHWIDKSISNCVGKPNEIGGNKMISYVDDHHIITTTSDEVKKLNISKKKKFTICEGIKLFGIMAQNTSDNLNSMKFWTSVENNKHLPERTAEQMKKFYIKNEHETIEQWLVKSIHENVDFSFSVKNIPSKDFVQNFKEKYEVNFMRLESVEQSFSDKLAGGLSLVSNHSSVYS